MPSGATELERPVPLYMQVVRQLRARIASGELAEGDRIPSQREMMQLWHISMQTASKVIGALKTEGLAIPSVGRDTIVAPGATARIANAAQGTAHAASVPPESASTKVIAVTTSKTAAPAEIAEALGIPAGRRALRRVETHAGEDGKANSLVTAWYPPAVAEKAPRLADREPLPAGTLAYIVEAAATRAARTVEESAAIVANEATASALGVASGCPILITRNRYYTTDDTIIEYSETKTIPEYFRPRSYILTGNW
jgi:DNA-binding GntR family transcriptional regulator